MWMFLQEWPDIEKTTFINIDKADTVNSSATVNVNLYSPFILFMFRNSANEGLEFLPPFSGLNGLGRIS